MKKIKIVFILPSLNGGGAEKVSINYLRQLDSLKYDLYIITFDESKEILSLIPKEVKIINLNTISTKKSVFKLIKVIREISPDIVYTSHSRVASFLLIVKIFVKKFYHIARMQSSPVLEKKYNEYGLITRLFYSFGFKNANKVISQTEAMKEDAIKIFHLKDKNIEVMNNPLDIENIKRSVNESISPFKKGKITAVLSGRIKKVKAYDLVISGMKDILSIYPDFELHILGYDEGEKDNLNQLANKYKISDKIIYHDYISNPYAFYSKCDLFILSSHREGFPNAMLENYYLNTPIVATTCVPIVSKLIKNGVNGYLCNVGDQDCMSKSIIKCIKDIKRKDIKNPKYSGSNFEDLLKKNNLI